MLLFLKGIIVGIGGISPGLSGTILLLIFGLYRKTLDALGNLFRDLKKNIRFLFPLLLGMLTGVLLFSKLVDHLLRYQEMPTRFCFLGLILGTLPMVWREVRKEGFSPKYYLLILLSAGLSLWFFLGHPHLFPEVTDPTLLQSVLLGVAVAATAIVPGVDPAVFLSTLGFYEMYMGALANLEMAILLPMAVGAAFGAMGISYGMSQLFRRFYTGTFSVIFGIFLTMIPNMLSENCVLGRDLPSLISVLLLIVGFGVSFWLGDLENNNRRIRAIFKKVRKG